MTPEELELIRQRAKERPRRTRQQLLTAGVSLLNPERFAEAFALAAHLPEQMAVREVATIHAWAKHGFQSVNLPATYAAALMATDAAEALQGQRLPWPCFEIQVPPGLLSSSHGEVFGVIVSEELPFIKMTGSYTGYQLFLAYADEISMSFVTQPDLPRLFEGERGFVAGTDAAANADIPGSLLEDYDADREQRLWLAIKRLIAGVVLAINTARTDKPEAFPKRALRLERDGVTGRLNTHALGHKLTIDCRQAIREYVAGDRRNSPTVSTLVRGHWRNRAHGPRHTLRRMQWIQPFFRGEGVLISRPIEIKPPEKS